MLQTFPRSARLTKTDEFSSVFSFQKCLKGKFLSLYYFPNCANSTNLTNFHEKSKNFSVRLGIVIGKKILKKSVDRNRCKRILRDIFRKHRYDLNQAIDIILRLNCKNFTEIPNYNNLLREDFLYLFNRLKKTTTTINNK